MSRAPPDTDDAEISLLVLWRAVWRNRLLVALIAAVTLAIAIAWAMLATPIYRAEVVVVEVHESAGQGGLGALAGQLSGLASLAGVNINAAGSNTREHQAVMRSRQLVERFVTANKLLPALAKGSSKTLTLWKAVRQVQDGIVNIQEDTRRGVTTISVEWTDPRLAALWANNFVALANDSIRAKAVADAQRNISYLEKRINETNSLEVQQLMYSLIESETKTLMLANGRAEYAFAVVDPARVPEIRVSPRRTLMAAVGLTLGLALGMLAALLRGAGPPRSPDVKLRDS
jgi:uncharacterized protein involved in exopolysaccharide biosynthesis